MASKRLATRARRGGGARPGRALRRGAIKNIALVVDGDVDLPAVLHRLAAPDAVIAFLELGDVPKAFALDPRLSLAFGEAVGALNRPGRRPVRVSLYGGVLRALF